MKKATEIIYVLIALIIILGTLYFFYKGLSFFVNNIDKININILVAIIGGTITISSFFITRFLEKRKQIEFEIRNKKIPIYEEFFQFYFRIVFNERNKKGMSETEMINFFRDFNQKAIIWFPDTILKSYINWKKNLIHFSRNNNEENLAKLIFDQEELMRQFRKDIGHSNKNLLRGDITSLYINDIDKYL